MSLCWFSLFALLSKLNCKFAQVAETAQAGYPFDRQLIATNVKFLQRAQPSDVAAALVSDFAVP